MTTTLRSYDHYAPDIAATVLPGAALPTPVWGGAVAPRSSAVGSQVHWADGSVTPTVLLRVADGLAVYELTPGASGTALAETAWSDSGHLGDEWTLTQVLAQGFGAVGLDELRRRVRRAGYAAAANDLTEPDAVAATQAAVWRITTGRELDLRQGNSLAVRHLYDYLLARAGLAGYGRGTVAGPGRPYLVAGVTALEIAGAEVVDAEGRSLHGIVTPGQRFHLRGRPRHITLRHGAVRARLLRGEGLYVTVTSETPVVVDHVLEA